MEYDKFAQGLVHSLGGATPVILPFQPNYISIFNSTRAAAVSGVTRAWWSSDMGQGAAGLVTTAGGPVDGTSFIAAATGTGFSTFQAGLSLQYGPVILVDTVTKAAAAVVTALANHNLVDGDVVVISNLYQTATTGLQQICSMPLVVTVTGATTFTVPVDTSGAVFTAYDQSTAVTAASFKKVLYPFLYAPGISNISGVTRGVTTLVTTTAPHNLVVGQEVAFRIPAPWGIVELNSLPNVLIPGSPKYGFVTIVNSPTSVTVNIDSSSYTAFSMPSVTQTTAGLAAAQIVAVGDNNSGSNRFGFLSPLVNGVATINGPAIAGAYLNNTNQGFIIGSGVAATAADHIYWEARYASIV